jgi:hypothetical protein
MAGGVGGYAPRSAKRNKTKRVKRGKKVGSRKKA